MEWFVLGVWLWASMSVFGCTKGGVDEEKRWAYALFCILFWWAIGFYCATGDR